MRVPRATVVGAALLAALPAWVLACGTESDEGPAPAPAEKVDSLVLSSSEEILAEIEMLGYEIADLEAWVASPPPGAPADPGAAPGERLAAARRALEAAPGLLAAGDTTAAVDSLKVVHVRVEDVKRALGLAEEWGEEFPEEDP